MIRRRPNSTPFPYTTLFRSGQPRLCLSSAPAGTRDGGAYQLSDRRPSPFATGRHGIGAARLDCSRARSDFSRVARTASATGRFGQGRGSMAPVESMESHLQKKLCTPASKAYGDNEIYDGSGYIIDISLNMTREDYKSYMTKLLSNSTQRYVNSSTRVVFLNFNF